MPAYPDITPQWLKSKMDPSVLDSTLTKVIRALATAIGADDPASQVMGLMGTNVPTKAAAKGIKAFHGSPHDFDKFSMQKIGTGEGAQAYGHGLYFAENEAVARSYRDDLSKPVLKYKGGELPAQVKGRDFLRLTDDQVVDEAAKDFLRDARSGTRGNANVNDIVEYATGQARVMAHRDPERRSHWLAAEQRIKEMAQDLVAQEGRMYEVNIKADPEQFLDWDAPLSQQPENVKTALNEYGIYGPRKTDAGAVYDPPGSVAYDALRERYGKADVASDALRVDRIPGIKYLDGGSRTAGQGSRNYVVFDDSLIDIIRKFGLMLPLAGAASQAEPLDVNNLLER